jgi:REP element-mobilizing transposase RayT
MELRDNSRGRRRSIRLPERDYRRQGPYFVTVCTYERRCILWETTGGAADLSPLGKIVRDCWEDIPRHSAGVVLDEFVVMPNHLHGVLFLRGVSPANGPTPSLDPGKEARSAESGLSPGCISGAPIKCGPAPGSLGAIVGSFKAAATRTAMNCGLLDAPVLWQRNYHEYVIRDLISLERTRSYIRTNPARWDTDSENPDIRDEA